MKKETIAYLVVIIGLVITSMVALMSGVDFLTPLDLWRAINGNNADAVNTILNFRAPRWIASLICGGMLAAAGALSQSVFSNSLADPTILGVTSGGDLLILLGGLFLPTFPMRNLILAFIGGGLALWLLINKQTLRTPYKLIIVGVALNLTFVGLKQLFTQGISTGIVTGFNGITWPKVLTLLVIGCIGLFVALLLAPWANYLKLPDQQLASVGVPATLIRLSLLILVVVLSAGVTTAVSTIPFIGIIVPSIGRKLVGHDYQTLIPFSILGGAWLLLIVDTVGRLVVLPSEISAATIMTIIGGPFLVFLVQRRGFNGTKAS